MSHNKSYSQSLILGLKAKSRFLRTGAGVGVLSPRFSNPGVIGLQKKTLHRWSVQCCGDCTHTVIAADDPCNNCDSLSSSCSSVSWGFDNRITLSQLQCPGNSLQQQQQQLPQQKTNLMCHKLQNCEIIIIIIERRDFGGIMSNECKDTLQTQNKTVRVRRSRMSKVSIRYRRRQSCCCCCLINHLKKTKYCNGNKSKTRKTSYNLF